MVRFVGRGAREKNGFRGESLKKINIKGVLINEVVQFKRKKLKKPQ